jgi:hypothetical protein
VFADPLKNQLLPKMSFKIFIVKRKKPSEYYFPQTKWIANAAKEPQNKVVC